MQLARRFYRLTDVVLWWLLVALAGLDLALRLLLCADDAETLYSSTSDDITSDVWRLRTWKTSDLKQKVTPMMVKLYERLFEGFMSTRQKV